MVNIVKITREAGDISSRGRKTYFGVDADRTGSNNISMKYDVFPPSVETKDHARTVDTAVYVVRGRLQLIVGGGKEQHIVQAGDFLFIPAGEVHRVINAFGEPAEAVVAIAAARFEP